MLCSRCIVVLCCIQRCVVVSQRCVVVLFSALRCSVVFSVVF